MKKTFLLLILLLSITYLVKINKVESQYVTIPNEAIRLRVIANSNSDQDQKIKMKLSIKIQSKIQELLSNVKDINEARTIIKENLSTLNDYVETVLKENNCHEKYTLFFGNNFFPEKKYNDVIYKKGYYESLVITLGKGTGNNWWCVLFPPLCLMEAEESDNIEYKFFVKELIDKYF